MCSGTNLRICGSNFYGGVMRRDFDQLINKIKDALFRNKYVVFAYLYGSLATKQEHPFSDIDIAVYVKDDPTYRELLKDIPDCPIDLKILNDLPPIFCLEILRKGILLFCKDEQILEDFVFETLKIALDEKPKIDEIRREILKALVDAV